MTVLVCDLNFYFFKSCLGSPFISNALISLPGWEVMLFISIKGDIRFRYCLFVVLLFLGLRWYLDLTSILSFLCLSQLAVLHYAFQWLLINDSVVHCILKHYPNFYACLVLFSQGRFDLFFFFKIDYWLTYVLFICISPSLVRQSVIPQCSSYNEHLFD